MAEIDPLNWKNLSKEDLKTIWGKETAPKDTPRIKNIRKDFIELLDEKVDHFLDILPYEKRPTLFQEIPLVAKDMLDSIDFPRPDEEYTTTKGSPRTFAHAKGGIQTVQLALTLAKKLGLMDETKELPLRRVWYAFIKATLEKALDGYVYGKGGVIGDPRKPDDGDYTNAFSQIIKNTNLWYSDFGIKNPSATASIVEPKYFPPILIGLEKRSYYDVLQAMSELLGFSIYSAGGQSKFAEQEVLAKEIKEKIFDQYTEFEGLDIYIISDFDPAGIDIALNIGEHQKFYQERFDKTVTTERLAPMPEHYTDSELKQGLYTVESSDRESWNYPEAIQSRELIRTLKGEEHGMDEGEYPDVYPDEYKELRAEFNKLKKLKKALKTDEVKARMAEITEEMDDFEYIGQARDLGLEVESLPDIPIKEREDGSPVLLHPPTDWDDQDYDDIDGNWKGLTRMRFILFDKLIDDWGLDKTFEVLLEDAAPYASTLADEYIDESNFKSARKRLSKTGDLVRLLLGKPAEWIKDYITTEKGDLESDIQEWIDDIIEQYIDEDHEEFREEEKEELIEEIMNGLYYAISRDYSSYSIDFPVEFEITDLEEKEEDFMIEIPEELIKNLKPIIDYSLCLAANVQEAITYIKDLEEPHMRTTTNEYGTEVKTADGKEMLSKKFEFPKLRQCESVKVSINQRYPYNLLIDEVVWKEGSDIEGDCEKYRTQISNLQDEIDNLETDIGILTKQIEEEPDTESRQFKELAEERLHKISEWEDKFSILNTKYRALNDTIDTLNTRLHTLRGVEDQAIELQKQLEDKPTEDLELKKLAEDRLTRIGEMRAKENELKAKLEEIQADYTNRTKQLQEAHDISLDYVKTAEAKIKKLEKEVKAKPKPKPEVEKSAIEKYAEAKDLKQQKKEEKEAELLGTQAFRYWQESEINHPKIFKQRIQLYYSQTQDISEAIQGLIDEKIGTMEKLYKKSFPKLKDTVGEEYTKQMALLSGDLNRLSNDIKKLFYYGR
jgi:hypothetical protein